MPTPAVFRILANACRPASRLAACRLASGVSARTSARLLSLLLFALLVCAGSLPVRAETYVFPGEYPTIQAAINAVHSGDTVEVAAGTYTGAGNVDLDFGGKNITLLGAGAGQTILNCQGTSGANHRGFAFVSGESSAAKVQGFTVENGYDSYGGAAVLIEAGSSPTFLDDIFQNNTVAGDVNVFGGAVLITGGTTQAPNDPTFTNCLFTVNTASGTSQSTGGALCVANIANVSLIHCTFSGNQASGGSGFGGAVINANSTITLTDCILYGDSASTSGNEIYSDGGTTTVTYSDIQGGFSGTGNFDADPQFLNPNGGDYHIPVNSPANAKGTPAGATDDLDGQPYSDPPAVGAYQPLTLTFPGEYATIQAAINASFSGDTVSVAAGTYTGSGNVDLDFGGRSSLTVQGAGASSTIIDCGGSSAANHRGFYFHSGEQGAVVAGLTVKNGYESTSSNPSGGGVLVESGCQVTLNACTLSGNTAAGDGGGFYNQGGTVTLSSCTLSGNSAQIGGGLDNFGTATLTACTLSGNSAYDGGGLSNNGGTATLTACTLSGNTAYDGNGGGLDNFGTATLSACLLSGNTAAGDGGGLDNNFGMVTLSSCTLSGNSAPAGNGGGFYNQDSGTATLTDDILYGDTGGEIVNSDGSVTASGGTLTATYSDVQGGYSGTGNFDAPPLFVGNGDYHLTAPSPAINAGVPVPGVTTDLDGNARQACPSLGAYEFNGTAQLTVTGNTFAPTAEQSFTVPVATLQDNNPNAQATDFSVTIHWEDGTSSAGTVAANGNASGSDAALFTISGTHTYAQPGQYSVVVNVTNTICGGSATGYAIANVGGAYAETAVHNSPNPSVYGESVTATDTVTDGSNGNPVTEGSVQFSVRGVNVGSPVPLNAQGLATYNTSSLPVGVTRITGTYSDTGGKYAGGTSFEDQTVNQASTTTSVVPNPSSPDDTQTVTFSATVAPVAPGAGTPTGSVTFTINGAMQTAALSGGKVSVQAGPFAPGPVSYSAVYQSDTNFLSSGTGPQSVSVSPGPATHFRVSAPSAATAGTSFNVTVTALDSRNATATGYTGTVYFTSTDAQAALPANATLTNGTGTFSVTLKTAGGQTVTATDTVSSTVTGTSASIGVSPAAPSLLAFVQQPTGAGQNAAITPAPSVKVTDAYGNPLSGISVTLSLSTGTGTLSGVLTQTTGTNGVATFPGLSINLPGSKALTATAGSLTLQSNAFTIADTTPPVTTGGSTTAPGAVQVTLSATDNYSGVASTTYQVDTGSPVTVTNTGNASPFVTQFLVSTAGPHTVTYYSTDGVGNKEAAKTLRFSISANAAPTLSSLSPTGTDAQASHADLVLTVNGSGFVQGFDAAHSSVVTFNGVPLVTTYVSSSKLTAVIPGALLASAGVFNVTVVTPAPGGGTSGSKTFTVQANSLTGLTLSNGSANIIGGKSVTGTVTLLHSALGADVVSLTSSNPAVLSVPSSVTVAAGSSVATFPGVSVPVAVDTPVTVTARYNGVVKSVTTLIFAPRVVSLSVSSLSVKGGQSFTVQVGLSSSAPAGGLAVSLTAARTTAGTGVPVSVPGTLVVSGGSSGGAISAGTVGVSSPTLIKITASVNGTSKSANISVMP